MSENDFIIVDEEETKEEDNIHGLKIKCLYIGLKPKIEMKYIVQ